MPVANPQNENGFGGKLYLVRIVPRPVEPLLFDRISKEKVWGGERLVRMLGAKGAHGLPVGETWELSDVPQNETRVRGGTCAGYTLRKLMATHPYEILGRSTPTRDGRFPLLVKFIDAKADLSVQVHPPDGPKSPSGVGKTEAWFVLDADPGAEVICGLKSFTSQQQLEAAIVADQLESCLNRVPVKRGDVVFVPAGQVHAILGGVLLVEVQQSSDATYRLFDWNRPAIGGLRRELHTEQALDVVNYHLSPGQALQANYGEIFDGAHAALLGSCSYFDLTAVRIVGPHIHENNGFASTITVTSGSGVIDHPGGLFKERELRMGDVLLIPGTLDQIRFIPDATGLELFEGLAR